jgi:hypothetical protein
MKTVFFIFLIFISFYGCSNEENNLTDEEFRVADSLFRIREPELQTKLDSVCDSVYKIKYPKMVDSIKKIRMKEISDLIEE